MDIFGWATHNIFNLATTVGITFGASFLIYNILKQAISNLKEVIAGAISDMIRDKFRDPADRKLAGEIVYWIEQKFPDSIGQEKRDRAVSALTKAIPMLSTQDAGNLVDLAVSEMNASLKLVQEKI